jgi:hypothetical protein
MHSDDRFRQIHHRRGRSLLVAEPFGDLPAGETALFAAGRTLADAGRRVSAAHWLHRYLDRYPSGRFTVEAKERLAGGNRP